MNEEAIDFQELAEKLPPIISRDRAATEILGNMITSKTLANLDSQNQGCPLRVRMVGSRKVGYPTIAFLNWIKKRIEIIKSEE